MALDADLDMRIVQDVVNHDRDEMMNFFRPHHGHRTIRRSAHASQLCDAKYSTEFLSTFVRERESFDLEQAVLSRSVPLGYSASRPRNPVEGGWADVVVFDMDNVGHDGKRAHMTFPLGPTD